MIYKYEDCSSKKEELIESFRYTGVLHIKGVFNTQLCSEAIEEIISIESDITSSNTIQLVTEQIGGKTKTKYYQGIYQIGKSMRKFFNLKLLELASWLVEDNNVYYSDLEAHLRNPGGGSIPKHQDNFYFNLSNAKGVTCYIALSKHDKNTGA